MHSCIDASVVSTRGATGIEHSDLRPPCIVLTFPETCNGFDGQHRSTTTLNLDLRVAIQSFDSTVAMFSHKYEFEIARVRVKGAISPKSFAADSKARRV